MKRFQKMGTAVNNYATISINDLKPESTPLKNFK